MANFLLGNEYVVIINLLQYCNSFRWYAINMLALYTACCLLCHSHIKYIVFCMGQAWILLRIIPSVQYQPCILTQKIIGVGEMDIFQKYMPNTPNIYSKNGDLYTIWESRFCSPILPLNSSSATLMFQMFQYWMVCQPDLCSHTLNNESIFGHSDVSDIQILDSMSAWFMQSSIDYWVHLHPLRCL